MQPLTLIFATNNAHKIAELQAAVGDQLTLITLEQAGISIDIPEPFDSLEQNAAEKSRVIHELTGQDCFSEDTGLFVDALHGAPGVHSARYAGEGRSANDNIDKLLRELGDTPQRTARFRTVISLILNGESHSFEGVCEGRITVGRSGPGGFGYDPIFTPDGATRSFADMTSDMKNFFSHRRKAAEELIRFLYDYQTRSHG